jgi:hypothetical protein
LGFSLTQNQTLEQKIADERLKQSDGKEQNDRAEV